MKKQILSMLLAVVMVVGLVPGFAVMASAAETVASGTCGTSVNWTLDDNGLLTISGTGKMTSSPWRDSYKSKIKEVVIEDGVTSICSSAFNQCSYLTTITVKGDLTEVGGSAFQNCSRLTSATFMGDVGTVGYMAFNSSTETLDLTINGNATSFGQNVFDLNYTTVTITYRGTNTPSSPSSGQFYEGMKYYNNFKIYVTPAYYAQSSSFCNRGVERPVLNITVTPEGNGTAVAQYNGNPVTSLGMKRVATLVATPDEGYYLKEYQVVSGGVTIDEKKQFTVGQENIEIKAIFEAIPAGFHTVSFDANGGTGNMDMIAIKGGETGTLPQNLFKMTYYNFKEWNTAADGSGTPYADKAEISVTENTTLYAQWEKITYSVTYDANGGTGTMAAETVAASGSKNYTFPACSFTAPEGGVFAGWKYGTGQNTYTPGESIWITKDITVTAQWNIPAAAVTIDGTTTHYGTLELAAAAVEDKTATVKLLDNVTLTDRLTFNAENLTLDLNNKTISNYYLTLYNTVSITGPGTLEGYGMWLDIEQNATVTINEGVAITKNSTAVAILLKYGSKLILNGGSITLSDTTSGQIAGQDYYENGPIVVVNADGVANRFGDLNVYYNITPTTKPSMSVLSDGNIYYRIDNQIADTTLDGTVTYDGNTYAMEGANVTVSPNGGNTLTGCYFNGTAATETDGSFTFVMPAAVTTITVEKPHAHDWAYSGKGAVITATCDNNCGIITKPTLTLAVTMTNNAPVVSVTPNATWTTANGLPAVPGIIYVDGSNLESATVPTAAGIYTAKMTVSGEVASVTFEILDYTGIDTAISSVPADMSNYTDETVNAVNAAKTAAETAKSSATSQAELNSAATALTNAINALALKPADYTAVDTALATVPADLSVYTAETKAAVEAAISAVVRGKNITEQATVTGYATAIENAVAALITELRSAEITVAVPAKGATPTTSAANGTGYTVGALSWNGSPEVFLGSTEYTVTFTLTAADKYVFASNAAITVPGAKDGGVSAEVAQDGKTVSVSATFPATLAKGVTSVVIKTMPTDTDYTYGDAFDPVGLILTVSYDDSSVEDVTYNDETKAAFSFGSELNVSTTAVTVTYGGKSANIAVTVVPKALTIAVADKSVYVGSQKPDLSAAEAGKDYTVDGLVSGDTLTVALSYVTEPDMKKSGEYEITAIASDSNYAITVVNGKLKVRYYPVYSDPTYTPTVDDTTGGDTTVSDKNPEKGDKVTIITDPDKGYEVGEITVTDSKGNEVEVIDNGDGTYTYVQPVGKVTITVTYVCNGTHNCPSLAYSDLNTSLWYHSATDYVIENGLMNGIGGGKFDPSGTTSRAMIVTILWRLEGQPVVNYLMQFDDIPADTWYTEAVRWAASEKIVEGYGDTFGPNDPITREQFATILWRYAKYKGYDVSVGEDTNILSYNDAFDISEWAIPAMQWACGAGLMQGDGVNLTPKADATRTQAAALFQRFCENVAAK